MRKIIVVFSLIALLTFVFPVAARSSSPAINVDNGEGGSVLVTLSYLDELMTAYIGNFSRNIFAEHVIHQLETQVHKSSVMRYVLKIVEGIAHNQVNPSH